MARRSGSGNTITSSTKTLSRISGPEEMTTSVAYLTAVYSRNVFRDLQDKGLSIQEIGICVLLLLGVRVNELEDILNRKSIYNISRDIRAKIGAKGDAQNIRQYLERIVHKKQAD